MDRSWFEFLVEYRMLSRDESLYVYTCQAIMHTHNSGYVNLYMQDVLDQSVS